MSPLFTLSVYLSVVLSTTAALAQPTYQYNDRAPNHYYNNDAHSNSSNDNTSASPLAAISNAVTTKTKETKEPDAAASPVAGEDNKRPSYVRTKQIDAYPPGVKTGGAKPTYSDLYSAKHRAMESRE